MHNPTDPRRRHRTRARRDTLSVTAAAITWQDWVSLRFRSLLIAVGERLR